MDEALTAAKEIAVTGHVPLTFKDWACRTRQVVRRITAATAVPAVN
jgi:hypothetical protein